MAITQVISTLPTAPDPSTMTRDQFSTAAATSVLAQKAMVPEINTWTSQVNAIVSGTAGDIASGINGAAAKTTPVDADLLTLTDSASSFTLKKFTWANLKATLGSTFAALAGSASQAFSMTTAAQGTNTTQGASTAFVINEFGKHNNIVINGGFTINQRVYVSAATLASGSFGHDRWKAGAGGGNYSFTQLASNTTITIAANKTLIQVVESNNVQATSYVLSWTGTTLARYAVNSATPTGSYAASPILITGQTVGTTMSIEFGNGASSGTLGKVNLEEGSVATQFEYRTYGAELALCQRYYWSTYSAGVAPGTATTVGEVYMSATVANDTRFTITYPTTMQGVATMTVYSPITGASGNMANISTAADVVATQYVSGFNNSVFRCTGTAAVGNYLAAHFVGNVEL